MKKLKVLCPQEYVGMEMNVTPCTRCSSWAGTRCDVYVGVEHLPEVSNVPTCPIQDRCQHQLQATGPCVVRRRGLVCESALVFGGMPPRKAANSPIYFHAMMMEE